MVHDAVLMGRNPACIHCRFAQQAAMAVVVLEPVAGLASMVSAVLAEVGRIVEVEGPVVELEHTALGAFEAVS